MLKIGDKGFSPPPVLPIAMGRSLHDRIKQVVGFTLIEVMLATVVLSVGTVLIQAGLLRSASLLSRYAHSLAAERWMDEKIWETKQSLFYSELPSEGAPAGSFTDSGKEFSWNLTVSPQEGKNLYLMELSVQWEEGHTPVSLKRTLLATNTATAS